MKYSSAALAFLLCACASTTGLQDGASIFLDDMTAKSAGAISGTSTVVFVGEGKEDRLARKYVQIVFVDLDTQKVSDRKSLPFSAASGPLVSRDGRVFVAKTYDHGVGVWSTSDGRLISKLAGADLPNYGWGRVRPGRNDEEIVVGDKIWRISDGVQVGAVDVRKRSTSKFQSEDGKLEVEIRTVRESAERQIEVEAQTSESKKRIFTTILEHNAPTAHAIFSPSGALVAIQSFNFSDKGLGGGNRISVLDTATGKSLRDLKVSKFCTFTDWHPTKTVFFLGCLEYGKGETIVIHSATP